MEMTARKGMIALALCGAFLVAACGSNTDKAAGARLASSIIGSVVGIGKSAAPQGPTVATLTRTDLAEVKGPLLRATLKSRPADALLVPIATNGAVVTWSTADNTTLGMKQGVLVATRGLVADLVSASVPSAAQLARGVGSHQRVHFYLDGEDHTVRRDYQCELSTEGSETIAIVERSYTTRHVVETCRSASGKITNHYWFESGSIIRQSRQWVSQGVGYLELRRIID